MSAPKTGGIVLTASSLAETRAIAGRLAQALAAFLREPDAPLHVFVGLDGDLGAGKTAFVQGFVSALQPDVEEDVTSPTFSIVQEYPTDPPVTHMDLYRLVSSEDLEAIGYRDHYFARGVTLVEWSERVPDVLPEERIEIGLAVMPSDVREIRIWPRGRKLADLIQRILE